MDNFYIISEDELLDLLEAYYYADCLDIDGVDNWDWYMVGKESYLKGKYNTFREKAKDELRYYRKLREN